MNLKTKLAEGNKIALKLVLLMTVTENKSENIQEENFLLLLRIIRSIGQAAINS